MNSAANILEEEKIIENGFETLEKFVVRILNESQKSNKKFVARFNWVSIIIYPNSNISADELVILFREKLWWTKMKKIKEKEWQIGEMITKLPSLNFKDFEEILDWIYTLEKNKKLAGLQFDKKKITTIFAQNWFEPNEDIDYNFSTENEERYWRYLVWLFLYYIKNSNKISEALPHLINIWKQKFGKEAKKTQERFKKMKI